jgi:hypothetical protein
MGTCTGVRSFCAIGGFALESRCHLGQVILYDTVQKLKWSVDARTHGIKVVVDKLLADDSEWNTSKKDEVTRSEGTQGVLSMFNWGWGRKKPGNTGDDDDPDEEVPPARSAIEVEGIEGECTVCFTPFLFFFLAQYQIDFDKMMIIGLL